jgi:long-chain acyl-CoA synthetase
VGRKKEIIATSGGKKIGPAGIEGKFVGDALIEHVVLYGDERKYLTALITLNEEKVSELASAAELVPLSYQDMIASEAVRGRVQAQIDAVNAELAPYETIKRFFLCPGHLSVEAGHLTPSLKLRRAKVWEDFAPQLDALYQRP